MILFYSGGGQDVIKKTLGQLRTQLRAVVDAHDRAITTIVEGKREREKGEGRDFLT